MGFTTRVKSEASEKKPFNFALFWDKYGTFFYPGDHRRHFWFAVTRIFSDHQ